MNCWDRLVCVSQLQGKFNAKEEVNLRVMPLNICNLGGLNFERKEVDLAEGGLSEK